MKTLLTLLFLASTPIVQSNTPKDAGPVKVQNGSAPDEAKLAKKRDEITNSLKAKGVPVTDVDVLTSFRNPVIKLIIMTTPIGKIAVMVVWANASDKGWGWYEADGYR